MKAILIVGLVCVIIFFVYKALKKPDPKHHESNPQPPPEPAFGTLELADARCGDTAVIRGADEDFADMHLSIDRIGTYEAGNDRWGEVSGIVKNRRVFVEWSDDDALEVTIHRGDRLRLRDLGVTEDDLGQFDEEQSDHNTVDYDGKRFHFVESQEAHYREDRGAGPGPAEGFYLWEFESDDGQQLWVEKWEDEPFEAGLSTPINPDTVTLYRA